MPVLDEFVMGYRWLMSVDKNKRISLALRVGEEADRAEYDRVLRELIGIRANDAVLYLLNTENRLYRTVIVSLLNLMSKAFNTKERLWDKGIKKTEGLNFNYDVKGKKVGIIGYGLYNEFFLGKCKEFHAFDFRREKELLSYRIKKDKSVQYPENIIWHLGENDLNNKAALESLDIVIMTGCTIVNNTYIEILKACKNAEIRGIYGPSSELNPEYLFDLGYNYIFSASVIDAEKFIEGSCAAIPDQMDLAYMDKYVLVRE